MTLSEVISVLNGIFEVHGELPVRCHDGMDPSDICDVAVVRVEYGSKDVFVQIRS